MFQIFCFKQSANARNRIACCIGLCSSSTMAVPELPEELINRIVDTAQYLERLHALHNSRVWRSIRWYVGNGDVQEVPPAWASTWFLQLVRALLNPNVHNIHMRATAVG